MFPNRLSLVLMILSLVLGACMSRIVPIPARVRTEPTQGAITTESPPATFTPTVTATEEPSPSPTSPPPPRQPTETPIGQFPTREPSPSAATTEPAIDPDTPGTVGGEICNPDDRLPAMTVYLENAETFALRALAIAKEQSSYELELPPGQYIAYAYLNRPNPSGGLYSAAVLCGLTAGCTDHNPLVFRVEAGQTISGIDICDWSAPEYIPANPAPFDPRLTGMVYTVYGVNYFRYDDEGEAQLLMSIPFGLEMPFNLVVSPDGKRGVFRDEKTNDLFILDFSSGEKFNLTDTPQIQETIYWWEPSMPERILFRALLEGEGAEPGYNGRLYAVDADGSDLQAIEDEHGPYYESVSPNGRTIAFGGGETALLYNWEAGVSEFNPREYSTDLPEDLFISSPAWSPDGKKIAWHLRGYFNEQYQNAYGIFDLEAKTLQLVHPYKGNGYGGFAPPAEWSPNGKWLALPVHASGVWLVDARQPGEEYYLGESTYQPVWHPEGKWLVYIHRDASGGQFYQVWVVNANKPEKRYLMGDSAYFSEWSPDGKWLAYNQHNRIEETHQIWLYNPLTEENIKTSLPPGAWAVDW